MVRNLPNLNNETLNNKTLPETSCEPCLGRVFFIEVYIMRAKVTYYGDNSIYVSGSRLAVVNQALLLMGRGWRLRDNEQSTGSERKSHCWLFC